MSTLQSGTLRDGLTIMRPSLAGGPVCSNEVGPNHYQTHNATVYSSPNSASYGKEPVSRYACATHKNFSQLPGFGGAPNGSEYFTTTMGTSFMEPPQQKRMPRYNLVGGREMSDIFGTRGLGKQKTPEKSTTTAMGEMTATVARKPQPRYVNGADFRGQSQVALDKNLFADGQRRPQTDFTTVTHSMEWRENSAGCAHRFDLPQKNTSTFLSTSLSVAVPGPSQLSPGDRVRVGVRDFSTVTDHNNPHARNYLGSKPPPGHYQTAHKTQFFDSGMPLVAAPGKGGFDRTLSNVPLSGAETGGRFTGTAHSASMYLGEQPPERRRTCASRGTLGTRPARLND